MRVFARKFSKKLLPTTDCLYPPFPYVNEFSFSCQFSFRCFTFNSLPPKTLFADGVNEKMMTNTNMTGIFYHWTLEDGYGEGYNDNTTSNIFLYPYRVLNAGSKAGLKLVMGIRSDDMDYSCRGPVQGFKVILHTPNELPQVDGQYFRVPIGQDVRVSIKPNVLKTTKSLRGYHPNRSGIFPSIIYRFYPNWFLLADDNASSRMSANFTIWQHTRSEIVNWNVWLILLFPSVDVSNFLCHTTTLHQYVA